jgi:hypothetical protein
MRRKYGETSWGFNGFARDRKNGGLIEGVAFLKIWIPEPEGELSGIRI